MRPLSCTVPESRSIRGSTSSAVTAVADIELRKCLDFCGPRPLLISARCTSRALKSLSSTKAPTAASAAAGVALSSGALSANPISNSKSRPFEYAGNATGVPLGTIVMALDM